MDSTRFYNTFYRLYPLIDLFLSRQKKKLAKVINGLPEGALLEIGTGNGSLLPHLQRHVITGIDTSEKMLEVAVKRQLSRVCSLKIMNGEHLDFDDSSFDYLLINHVLAVTPHPEQMLREAHRVLKKGGLLLIHNHFTPDNPLQHIDTLFSLLAPLFRFRSRFREEELATLSRFELMSATAEFPLGYYKLLILRK